MKVGELFVNLGIKGAGKTSKIIKGINSNLKAVAST